MSWRRHRHSSSPSATCLLSLFIEHRRPSTGLRYQAPGFQSALWEADRGWAGLGEASLPRSHQLLAQGLDVGTSARNPDGNCCHLIMRAYDISQKHLTSSWGLRQIKRRGAGFGDYLGRVMVDKMPTVTQAATGRLSSPGGALTPHLKEEELGAQAFWDRHGLESSVAPGCWAFSDPVLLVTPLKTLRLTRVEAEDVCFPRMAFMCSQ